MMTSRERVLAAFDFTPPDRIPRFDEFWEFHCALNEFDTLDRYREAISRRYGRADNVEQFTHGHVFRFALPS